MDAQRALLDELMGRNRNGDRPGQDVRDFRDARVCRGFLCGLCPHDLFQNTKMDLGECAKLHAPKLKLAFESDPRAASYGFEQELERELVRIVSDVDRKIARAQARLEAQDGVRAPSLLLDVDNCKEVLEVTSEIQQTIDRAEQAGLVGEVDVSLELMAKVDELMVKRTEVQANAMVRSFKPTPAEAAPQDSSNDAPEGADETAAKPSALITLPSGQNVNQKLRVCDVCGAFLSIFDSDRRLADHFGGKLHLGFLQIRRKIDQIATERRTRRRANSGTGSPTSQQKSDRRVAPPASETRGDRHSRSRSRSRSRARRDDRPSRRDRDRDRESSRRHRRHRSPSRSRSRGRRR